MKQLNQLSNNAKNDLKQVALKGILCTSAICCSLHSSCHAEETNATGGFGVNRRVETPAGYTKVWGTFTVTEVTATRAATAANGTRPTLYFGARNGIGNTATNSEAGLQYEQSVPGNPTPSSPFGIPAGWVIFTRWSHSDLNNANPEGWIQAYTPNGNTFLPVRLSSVSNLTMTYHIQGGGGASLDVAGVAKFFSQSMNPWLWVQEGNPRPTSYYPAEPSMAERIYPAFAGVVLGGYIRMRRVVGITQTTGVHGRVDGSSMTAEFSSGRIGAFVADQPNQPLTRNWLPERVNQAETGYDIPARLPGVAEGNAPVFVVEFPEIDARAGNASTDTPSKARRVARRDVPVSYLLTEDGITRYENETARLTLRANPGGRGRVKATTGGG